jgi:hypothetical protein
MKRSDVLKLLEDHQDAEIVLTAHRSCDRTESVALHIGHDWYTFDIRTFRVLESRLEQVRTYSGGATHFVYRLNRV